jgi:hypothetical protein
MNIIYNFLNLKTEVAPLLHGNQNVITRVRFDYNAKDLDSGNEATYVGFHDFEVAPGAQIMPFNQLSEAIVKSWLEANVDRKDLNPFLAEQIQDKILSKNVSIESPWETATAVVLDDSFPVPVATDVV